MLKTFSCQHSPLFADAVRIFFIFYFFIQFSLFSLCWSTYLHLPIKHNVIYITWSILSKGRFGLKHIMIQKRKKKIENAEIWFLK